MEKIKKRKKRKTMSDQAREKFIWGLVTGLILGFTIGAVLGAWVTYDHIVQDLGHLTQEIRIKGRKMDLERIEIDRLTELIRGWQMEIDEIWIYYGTNLQYRTRAMSSDEGRPSKGD